MGWGRWVGWGRLGVGWGRVRVRVGLGGTGWGGVG